MEGVVCDICIQEYQSGTIVPRLIDCGHSFCTSCITKQFNSARNCPKCRESLTRSNSEAYPINYALLSIVDNLNNSATIETLLQKRVRNLKRKFISMETKLTEKKTTVDSNLSLIKTALKSIQELLDDDNLNVTQTNGLILDLNEKLEMITNNNSLNYYKLRNSKTLSRNDYQSNEAFLQDIYVHCTNNEEIFAVTRIDDEVKFARFSHFSNKLIMHAFGPSIEKNGIITIWFEDFKRSLSKNYRAFIDIYCNENGKHLTLIIKTLDSTLSPKFLKYCTGEVGPVYKGTPFYQGNSEPNRKSVLKTDCFLLNGKEASGNYEYAFHSDSVNYSTITANQIVCTSCVDGSLQIFQMTHTMNVIDAVGIIEEPKEFIDKIKYGTDLKINDSGLLIEF